MGRIVEFPIAPGGSFGDLRFPAPANATELPIQPFPAATQKHSESHPVRKPLGFASLELDQGAASSAFRMHVVEPEANSFNFDWVEIVARGILDLPNDRTRDSRAEPERNAQAKNISSSTAPATTAQAQITSMTSRQNA